MITNNSYLLRYAGPRCLLVGIMLCVSVYCFGAEASDTAVYSAQNGLFLPILSIMGIDIPEEWQDVVTILCGVCVILLLLRLYEEHQNQKLKFAYMRHEAEKAKIEEARRFEQLQAEADRKVAQIRINQLNTELKGRRDAMRRALVERIALARQIRDYAWLHGLEMPKWLTEYLNAYSFGNQSKWVAFLKEFDKAYSGYVPYLQQHYPTLTDNDLQYIVLATLGFDCSDIACLLGKTDRTIWNRRDVIKRRVGDDALHIEDWICHAVEAYNKSEDQRDRSV